LEDFKISLAVASSDNSGVCKREILRTEEAPALEAGLLSSITVESPVMTDVADGIFLISTRVGWGAFPARDDLEVATFLASSPSTAGFEMGAVGGCAAGIGPPLRRC